MKSTKHKVHKVHEVKYSISFLCVLCEKTLCPLWLIDFQGTYLS